MTASATDQDLQDLVPTEGTVTIAGVECTVRRIKLRELMLAARVLTAGMRDGLAAVEFEEMDGQAWIALLVAAIPEAHEELIDLIDAIVQPPDQVDADDLQRLRTELQNPEPETLLDLLPVVVEQERETFLALLGKFQTVLKLVSAPQRGATKAKAKAAAKRVKK
jgi:uncharacterized protein DUF6631